jgi:hypothetical protein
VGKAIQGLGIAAWTVMILSWFPLAKIETQALFQPHEPVGEYSKPMHVKGVVRYVTPQQEFEDNLAHYGFVGGWAVCFLCFGTSFWLKRREKNSK